MHKIKFAAALAVGLITAPMPQLDIGRRLATAGERAR